jgi:hypothetical protein
VITKQMAIGNVFNVYGDGNEWWPNKKLGDIVYWMGKWWENTMRNHVRGN